MQLDKFSDYALRILITLAVRAPDRVATSEIAALFRISENHLSKIATQLAREGFVRSERGRNGGLTLRQPAETISIGAVLRALKREAPVAECFGGNKTCLILPVCGLRGPLAEAQEAFFATLDSFSVADVMGQQNDLTALLGNEASEIDVIP
ncbi:RrF2 family transcriptional regulator [Sulfitobacter aestuarii]|uniref:RrF2 family transcriptional regulator n=1 Tax=Sulfitobacter aestuarii TaxID=2161676 RepID=A0ABW5U5K1_9RHOB